MSIAGCTTVTRNYLAFARLVGRTWMDHHPNSTFTIVVVDLDDSAPPTWSHRDIRVVGPDAIGIDTAELHRRAAMYDPAEISCSFKPRALRLALEEADVAVYLDGDIEVLDAMDDLEDLARARGVVLSPHNLHPLPVDGRLPDRFTIASAGIYNGGLVAVGRKGAAFLDWWDEQLVDDCLNDHHLGLQADQRWLDFVPSYFEHHVLRDPTFNVAYWNLHERPTTWDGETLVVGGRRVRCAHFSGLGDAAPWMLSRYMGDAPRIELRDHPAVARAARRYLEQVRAAGIEADGVVGYRFAHAAGTPIDRRARRVWRAEHLAARADATGSTPQPPDPFGADGGTAWLDWLRTPAEGDTVSRFLRRIWQESPDLQRAYPYLDEPRDRAAFSAWARAEGRDHAAIPDTLLPDHEDTLMDDTIEPGERPRRRPRPPDVRSQQPVDQLAEARRLLETDPETGTPSRGVRKVVDRMLKGRDERGDEVAKNLADALEELTQRVAELGDRLNRVNDELPEQAERIDQLDDEATALTKAHDDLTGRVEQLDESLSAERDRVDGALEQDVITASIVADTEQRLVAEVNDLWLRLDKLADDEILDDASEAEPDAGGADEASPRSKRAKPDG